MAKRARNSRQDAHSSLEQLRNDITTAAKIYSSLASKSFLYVYGDKYFELAFPKRCFRHLCGVDSAYTAERFYNDAKNGRLDRAQIAFNRQKGQSIRGAKKKAEALKSLLRLLHEQVAILENVETRTFTYKIGMTDLAIVLCLDKDTVTNNRNPLAGLYYPKSLRVDEKSIEKSETAELANFVFAKELSLQESKYDELLFGDGSELPVVIQDLVDESFWTK